MALQNGLKPKTLIPQILNAIIAKSTCRMELGVGLGGGLSADETRKVGVVGVLGAYMDARGILKVNVESKKLSGLRTML